ncbi:GNAT family N-acetyltransferase [Photobacterium sp. TY1-4]|uniref:GNAT family N-acetyltransferase n=1 Tax=Photobacterium sp. TY1-4 TaxID=2899122 RepID=UPI0021C11CEC|nr:GNAT family N-acetyltransferase [Photobacterium sp. TY1-4]UXI02296.1 GNAT family N-acetyltransferase [Photobacterium sp. TY1-4]
MLEVQRNRPDLISLSMKLDFELATARLRCRPYKSADLCALVDAVQSSVTALSPWIGWCHGTYDQQDAHAWIQASRQNWRQDLCYELALFERRNDQLIGSVSLNHLSPTLNTAELGYWIRASAQQQGYATEACQAVIRFAFNTLGLTRLEIVTHADNLASQHTALACQAKFECTARNRIYQHSTPCDGIVFSLIPEDIHPKRP